MAASAAWEDKLEQMFAEDPSCFISKLHWRRSRNGGRTIAQPAAPQRQLQASQQVAASPLGSSSLMAEVVINGILGHNGRLIELQVIKVLTDVGMDLQERDSTFPSSAGTWQSVVASTSSGPSGRLQLHLASEAELEAVRDLLHDKACQLGSDMVGLTVTDDAVLATQARNDRRGA
jgi:hypothetical protein